MQGRSFGMLYESSKKPIGRLTRFVSPISNGIATDGGCFRSIRNPMLENVYPIEV